jgi:hypothetical protein
MYREEFDPVPFDGEEKNAKVGKADERNVEVSNPVKEALPAKNARSI